MKLNLRLPDIDVRAGDPLASHAKGFYKRIADEVRAFAAAALCERAETRFAAEGEAFSPYGAVVSWKKTFENERLLSLYFDISVTDGTVRQFSERKAQNWDKTTGLLIPFSRIFRDKNGVAELYGIGKREFDPECFAFTGAGAEFYFVKEGGTEAVFRDFAALNEKNLLKDDYLHFTFGGDMV